MTFHAFGLNYETATVQVREAFAMSEADVLSFYESLPASFESEVILLSTCNRTEVYLFGSDADGALVREALSRRAGMAWPDAFAFARHDEAAVLHVLRVASGVASQVLGDAQILAQTKVAYRLAVEADRVGTVLHRLMHVAFRAAKRVRTETTLTDGAASVSSVAVHAARLHFESTTGAGLADRHVLLVGTGQMGISALRALRSIGVGCISLTNRSRESAEAAAFEFGATVVEWEDRHAVAAQADLVLVASGAPEPILYANSLPERRAGTTLVVDVALPRNVDPSVASRGGYALVDLDALNAWREKTFSARASALPAAEAICQEVLREYVIWVMHHEALRPALHALRDTFEAIRRQAVDQHAHRFADADRAEVELLTQSILQKLLAVPIVRLKSTDPDSLDFARGIRFLSHVFSRPECEDESARDISSVMPAAAPCPLDRIEPDVLESPAAHASRDPR
jgi:glutamyl-tRNA reductase